MTEFIAWAPSMAAFAAAAQATGFTQAVLDPQTRQVIGSSIKTSGTWQGSLGGWALAVVPQFSVPTGNLVDMQGPGGTIQVPEMQVVAGVWARLRWNDASTADRMQTFIAAVKAQGVTIYEHLPIGAPDMFGRNALVWTADGSTPGPDYLDRIGVIL